MKTSMFVLVSGAILAFSIGVTSRAATITVVASGDTWIQKNQPDTTFSTSVNPSTQLRDALPDIVRASVYQFTLPLLPAGEVVTGVSFRLVTFDNGIFWNTDLGYLGSNPNLANMTWNTAVSDGYITAGTVDGIHHGFGANATGTGDTWASGGPYNDNTPVLYTDNDASNGLAKYIKDTMSTINTVPITLVWNPSGNNDGLSLGLFYGVENGEAPGEFEPRPRLIITTVPEPTGLLLLTFGGGLLASVVRPVRRLRVR